MQGGPFLGKGGMKKTNNSVCKVDLIRAKVVCKMITADSVYKVETIKVKVVCKTTNDSVCKVKMFKAKVVSIITMVKKTRTAKVRIPESRWLWRCLPMMTHCLPHTTHPLRLYRWL